MVIEALDWRWVVEIQRAMQSLKVIHVKDRRANGVVEVEVVADAEVVSSIYPHDLFYMVGDIQRRCVTKFDFSMTNRYFKMTNRYFFYD
jgi:hypothetical protein